MPTDAVLYWRDTNTKASDPLYDTLDELIAAKPAQVIEFNDTNKVLVRVDDNEQPNVSDDPSYDPSGTLTVEKQFNGTYGLSYTLIIKSDVDQTAFRSSLRAFTRKVPIEPAYHEFGIFGFYHPTVTDFNIDPTNNYGFTIDRPAHIFIHGYETVESRLTLRIGGRVNLIP